MRLAGSLSVWLAAVALAAAGCGDGDDGDEERIRVIVEEIATDPSAVCDHLGAAASDRLGGAEGCRQLAAPGASGSQAGTVEVEEVEIDGDAATARIRTGEGTEELRLVREAGDWTIAID